MCQTTLRGVAVIALAGLAVACGGDVNQMSPAPEVVEALKRHFQFDDATGWLKSEPTRASIRRDLEASGYRSGGSERRGTQEIDGYSRATSDGSIGLSVMMSPNGDKVVAVNVMPITRPGQEAAKQLVDLALDSVDASTAGMGSGQLHYLGAIRLAEARLLKIMLRQDRLKNEVFSIMYAVSDE